jgi:RNA polymerase sigma factor (sigma-70 family)
MSANPDPAKEMRTTRTAPVVADLVARARDGDEQAWDALVERYAPLIWSICRRHRLSNADADDVGQSIWLQMVNHLDTIRDPAALAGWLATTTRRECNRALHAARGPHQAEYLPDTQTISDPHAATPEQELLVFERRAALREAFTDLSPMLSAADRGPSGAVRPDQRQAGHPGRQHRAQPRPLPGQAASAPGHRGADQR